MACGIDPDASAESCAINHWCGPLGVGRRERNKQWRADCPVPGCGARRSLEFDAPGKNVRWKSFCGEHDREAVRPYLAKIIGACMPGGSRREPVRHADLIKLATADIPPQSLRLGLLELAGMSTADALAKLGIGPTHKSRTVDPLRKLGR